MKKILFYNWCPVDSKAGGGVTIYQRNVITRLLNTNQYEIYCLNSGMTYTTSAKTEIKARTSEFGDQVKCFEIVNSPVLAPGEQSIRNLRKYLNDESLYRLVKAFIEDNGGFDVIHFNNLEGLSLKVLSLKECFPETKFIFSVHNYFPVCCSVHLWQKCEDGSAHNCSKASHLECVKCCSGLLNYNLVRFWRCYPNVRGLYRVLKLISTLCPDQEDASLYERFEKETIGALNRYMDCILAVSHRVKDIIVKHGANPEKVCVSYIGTNVADSPMGKCNADPYADVFHMVYMGYMRKDKGFYFFLEALKQIPEEAAKHMGVRIVARHSENDTEELRAIHALKEKYKTVELINGYNKDNQRELLQGMHLGVVPVLWEDNLPQIAIEQIAYGVPILPSDLGGASELCQDDRFVFRAGDYDDFVDKVMYLYNNRESLVDFWNHTMTLMTMERHLEELKSYYC